MASKSKKTKSVALLQKRYNSTKKPTLLKYPKRPKQSATTASKKKYLESYERVDAANTKKLKEWQENVNEANALNKKIFG
ncbi:hypothetical protein LEP1GSC188_3124 [Leptospira weilii serovar Topaz str. LT2116]|uniref:Uncharacterized protein n=1 Tax=Leptospira weilii serovar Topaz str. LT2116 TaxID=1088540 RepID=M3GVL2_9LEPT|nr:hypothetical protein LEP1GSC188_3124 [Leptospira weilii serovar Topaz str. LT2116]